MPDFRTRAEAVQGQLEENYAPLQYRFVEFLVEHLTDVSREFGGDLQQAMLLAVIGQVYLHALLRSGRDFQDFSSGQGDGQIVTPFITASRMADVTGIPRETVRRKLARLEQKGWIEQLPDGAWRLKIAATTGVAQAREGLEALDRRSIARIARLYAGVEMLLEKKG